MSNRNQTEENMPPEEGGGIDFHWTDILNYQKIFDFAGIEQGHTTGDQAFFWVYVMMYYIILLLPTFVVVRTLLFLILPKSILKWMFKV